MVRWRRSVLVVVPMVVASLFGSPGLAAAQLAPYCQTSAAPVFEGRLAELKAAIGAVMDDPVECAHVDNVSGDLVQNTTTGLAYVRSSTGVPTFTNGSHRWALAPMGLVEWDGPELDPPGAIAPPPVPGVPAPPPVPDVPPVPEVPQPGTNPQAPLVPGAPPIPGIPGIPAVPSVPGIPAPPPIPVP
jgi:hypothetical protein